MLCSELCQEYGSNVSRVGLLDYEENKRTTYSDIIMPLANISLARIVPYGLRIINDLKQGGGIYAKPTT